MVNTAGIRAHGAEFTRNLPTCRRGGDEAVSGAGALYEAIETGNTGRMEMLLAAQPGLVNSLAETPPPIHWAIYHDRREAVEVLLEHGADMELEDQDRGATPLDHAIVYTRKGIVRVLVSHGACLEGRLQLALKGASGGFEEYAELPDRREYEEFLALLREIGAAD